MVKLPKPAAKKAEAKVEETAVEEAAEEVLETPVEEIVAEETIAEETEAVQLKRLLPMKLLRTLLRQKLPLTLMVRKRRRQINSYSIPELPNPLSPLSVSEKSSTTLNLACLIGTKNHLSNSIATAY